MLEYVEKTADKTKASQIFKVGIATIYRWIARKNQTGSIEPSARKAYKKKIDDQKLIEYVEKNPEHFLSEIATHFNTTLQAIFYALQRLKITRKKTTLYKERNEEAREEFIQKIEQIAPEKRVYLDQSGVNQYLYRQHSRSLRGTKVFGEISRKRFGRQSIISALKDKKFLAPMCFEGTCDTELFNVWLKQELLPNLTPGQVLILDNASFHKLDATGKLVESYGCEILFLPPYSPDLNPIEKYWANMKTKIRDFLLKANNLSEAFYSVVLSM